MGLLEAWPEIRTAIFVAVILYGTFALYIRRTFKREVLKPDIF